MDLTPYLKLMIQKGASDLFIGVGATVKIKFNGKISSVGKSLLTEEIVQEAALGIMNEEQKQKFDDFWECDFAINFETGDRFRVNVFRQRGNIGMVLRLIPKKIPEFSELNLPDVLEELVLLKRGLILMVGGTGAGKSTTLAAMLNHRNNNMSGHILTVEDPIEFSHQNIKSLINQREINVDTKSYDKALKAALREAPDVVFVGEIRDAKTMGAVMEIANTGHLAISTMHANNANQAIERVINMFPNQMHKQLLMDLSINIRSVISQRLLKKKDGVGQCVAVEVLINTPHIADLILKGDLDEMKVAMSESGQHGMQTFDESLYQLYADEVIDMDEALNNADSRSNLESRINFG